MHWQRSLTALLAIATGVHAGVAGFDDAADVDIASTLPIIWNKFLVQQASREHSSSGAAQRPDERRIEEPSIRPVAGIFSFDKAGTGSTIAQALSSLSHFSRHLSRNTSDVNGDKRSTATKSFRVNEYALLERAGKSNPYSGDDAKVSSFTNTPSLVLARMILAVFAISIVAAWSWSNGSSCGIRCSLLLVFLASFLAKNQFPLLS